MKTKNMVVLCAALAASSSIALDARQGLVRPVATQGQGGVVSGPSSSPLNLDLFVARTPLESRVVKGQPYAAEIVSESVQTLADGNRIVRRSTGRVYRDSDGRIRREDDRASGTPAISIIDPVANLSYTLDVATRIAREAAGSGLISSNAAGTFTFSSQAPGGAGLVTMTGGVGARGADAGSVRGGGAGAVGGGVGSAAGGVVSAPRATGGGGRGSMVTRDERVEEQLPAKTIDGVIVSGVRRTTTIPKGAIGNDQPIKIVSEEWTSSDLQVLVLTDLNDPRTGHATYQLKNINRNYPDPALFKVPADYAVQKIGGGRGRGGN